MIKVGVTGGIGSGKSVVCELIELLGFHIYYSDSKAKELMVTNPNVIKYVKKLIGDNAYNEKGEINRNLIASVIFSDENMLKKMNDIIHPEVIRDFQKWSDSLNQNDIVFIESAVLIEAGLLDEIYKLIVVSAPKEVRINRVIKRDKTTITQIESRMAVQMDQEKLCTYADYIIYSDDKQLIMPQIISIMKELEELSKSTNKR